MNEDAKFPKWGFFFIKLRGFLHNPENNVRGLLHKPQIGWGVFSTGDFWGVFSWGVFSWELILWVLDSWGLHLTNVSTKYQLPTPYGFWDIAQTRFSNSRSLWQGQRSNQDHTHTSNVPTKYQHCIILLALYLFQPLSVAPCVIVHPVKVTFF